MAESPNPLAGNEFWQPGTGARQFGYAAPDRARRVQEIQRVIRAAARCPWLPVWLYTPDETLVRAGTAGLTEWIAIGAGDGDDAGEMLTAAAECIAWRGRQAVALPGLRIPVMILDITEPLTLAAVELYQQVVATGRKGGVSTVLVVPEPTLAYAGSGQVRAAVKWTTAAPGGIVGRRP